MKNILVIGLATLLLSCGSGGKGDGKDSTGSDAKHSELFELLNINSDGLPFGSKLGMKIEEVKKNHKEAPDKDSDNEVLQYTKKIGPDDWNDQLAIDYSFDTETGEMTYETVDITSSKVSDGKDLYKELNDYYTDKVGKGTSDTSNKWENQHYVMNSGGKKTEIIVERNQTETEYAWVIVTVEEYYE